MCDVSRTPKWAPYCERIMRLALDEYVDFPELGNDKRSLNQFRVMVSVNRASMMGQFAVRPMPEGVRVIRVGTHGGEQSKKRYGKYGRVIGEEKTLAGPQPVPLPVVAFVEQAACREKACPYPARANGLCAQHSFWEKQSNSVAGSTLSPASLVGA